MFLTLQRHRLCFSLNFGAPVSALRRWYGLWGQRHLFRCDSSEVVHRSQFFIWCLLRQSLFGCKRGWFICLCLFSSSVVSSDRLHLAWLSSALGIGLVCSSRSATGSFPVLCSDALSAFHGSTVTPSNSLHAKKSFRRSKVPFHCQNLLPSIELVCQVTKLDPCLDIHYHMPSLSFIVGLSIPKVMRSCLPKKYGFYYLRSCNDRTFAYS